LLASPRAHVVSLLSGCARSPMPRVRPAATRVRYLSSFFSSSFRCKVRVSTKKRIVDRAFQSSSSSLFPFPNSPRRLPALPLPLGPGSRGALVEQPPLGVADPRGPERGLGGIMAAAGAERAGGREGCPAEDGHFRFGCGASACACVCVRCACVPAGGGTTASRGKESKRESKHE
jgi:hypothetical protein